MDIRASDEERARVVSALQQHTAAGRLSLDEFSDRASAAHTARTLDELSALTRDLPLLAPLPVDYGPSDGSSARQLLIVFAIAAATLVLLGIYMALTR